VYTGLSTTSNGSIVAFGAGAPGSLYLLACPGWSVGFGGSGLLWVPASSGAAPAAQAISPTAAASQAEKSIGLPSPVIGLNPQPFSVVALDTWMWIDRGAWHAYSATASVGSVTATAVATPVSVQWAMGDGSTVTCNGPGTAYRTDLPAIVQSTNCSHTYRRSSVGQPSPDGNPNDGAFTVTTTISWDVSWTSSVPGTGGSLPPLETTSSTRLRVEQVQSVDTAQ
jgi:hypothetical protein